ncbi:MAG TPA: hypothetical protein VGC41_15570 [Kofleriaceae bacterium]
MHKLVIAALFIPSLALACPKPEKELISETHEGFGIDVGDAGFTIYEGGAYKLYSHDPKAQRSKDVQGCLADKELADVKAALAKATWKTTRLAAQCKARSTLHTVWVAGKNTYDAVTCPDAALDEATQKLFTLVDGLETSYSAKK